MSAISLISLLIFNGIILIYIVIRFKGLLTAGRHPIVASFGFAFVFQEIFTLLLQFGPMLDKYFSPWLRNSIGVLSAIIAAHFFFEFARNLYLFALFPDKLSNKVPNPFIGGLSIRKIVGIERISLVLAIIGLMIFESYLGRMTSNLLTTLSVNIHHNLYLLVGRCISQIFIIFFDACTAFFLYLLTQTNYGRRRHIRIRTWFAIAGAIFIIVEQFFNLITTISIFFFSNPARVWLVWKFYDSIVLFPLGFCILVAAGPTLLVAFVDRSIIYFQGLILVRKITWLRNTLVKTFPEVDTSSFLIPTPLLIIPTQLQAYLSRVTTECSDALHYLFQYIALDEAIHDVGLQEDNQDEYDIEARLVQKGLSRKEDGAPIIKEDTAQSYVFPTNKAYSLVELLSSLAKLSAKLRIRMQESKISYSNEEES